MIRVNEKWDVPWKPNQRIQDVLDACNFTHHHIVISVNGTMVPPDEYSSWIVQDEDRIRVVHIIGGG